LIENISKVNAAQEAIKFVKNGMIVGLGTGSTAKIAIDLLGEKLSKDFQIKGMPTSIATEEQAKKLGIPLVKINEYETIDIAIDGADEVIPNKSLIKGLGGALLREKKVEKKANELIIIVDDTKMVDILGKGPLPVEVSITNYERTKAMIEKLGCRIELRIESSNRPFITDNGNYIFHLTFKNGISDPVELNKNILDIKGVKDTGLFLDMATKVIVGNEKGIQIIE
jgi:ribose 5-phosphate isomerase A|tara:strand:+ start:608 stop:1285 length:678 start_codon:yes stop_codon:yes gene_type:complete